MSQDGVTNPSTPDKLRPVHQYLKTDANGGLALDENGVVQVVTEDFDEDDIVDTKHILAIPLWEDSVGYAVGDIVNLDGASYKNIIAVTEPVSPAVNTFNDDDWESPLQPKNLPVMDPVRILGRRDAGAGFPQSLTSNEAKIVLSLDKVKNTFSHFGGVLAPTGVEDVNWNSIFYGIGPGLSFTPGSLWVDILANKAYICLDNTQDNAIWTEITLDTTYSPVTIGDVNTPGIDGLMTVADKIILDSAVQSVATDASNPIDLKAGTAVTIPVSKTSTGAEENDFIILNSDNKIDDSLISNLHITDVRLFDTEELRNESTATTWHQGDIAIVSQNSTDPDTGKRGSYIYTGTNQIAGDTGATPPETLGQDTVDANWSLLEVPTATKTEIDALSINAATVTGFTVGVNVPADASFTDLAVQDEDTLISAATTRLIFEGAGVTASDDGEVTVVIPGVNLDNVTIEPDWWTILLQGKKPATAFTKFDIVDTDPLTLVETLYEAVAQRSHLNITYFRIKNRGANTTKSDGWYRSSTATSIGTANAAAQREF